jgi:hypothetical protein
MALLPRQGEGEQVGGLRFVSAGQCQYTAVPGTVRGVQTDGRFSGAIDLLLAHWRRRDERWKPDGFGAGKEFRKLKYPFQKYSILKVMDILSMFPYAVRSDDFTDMLDFVLQKAPDGRFHAESLVGSYPEFDFGQIQQPSRWITFLVNRIQKRIAEGTA